MFIIVDPFITTIRRVPGKEASGGKWSLVFIKAFYNSQSL